MKAAHDWPTFERRPKILIVDDQPVNIRALHEIFRVECEVFMATSGQQAIGICITQKPDLVLLDVMMPDMDGYETLRVLQGNSATAHIPVIFVTGQSAEEDEEAALSVGAVDFISKPIRPLIVRARVRAHLTLKFQSDLLRQIAMIDGLTGVANRRRFDEAAQVAWKHCARENVPLSLALVDIDFFKQYNDTYGHLVGDACLKQVAQGLQSALLRPQDLLARYGGEEFACLLPATNEEGALFVANQLVSNVRNLGIGHASSKIADIVTVSIGCATIKPSPNGSFEQLTAQADAALYEAKRAGRNRVL